MRNGEPRVGWVGKEAIVKWGLQRVGDVSASGLADLKADCAWCLEPLCAQKRQPSRQCGRRLRANWACVGRS